MSSIEKQIRELMKTTLAEAAYPAPNQGPKDDSSPMQGSSQKPAIQMRPIGVNAAQPNNSVTPLRPSAGPMDSSNPKQGSSEDAKIDSETDQTNQGKVQSAKMKKQPVPMGRGAGAAPNFTTVGDGQSVINQSSSKGNVHQEQQEQEDTDVISEEEYNALSDEEKAEYVLLENDETENEDVISEEEYNDLSAGPEDEPTGEIDEEKESKMKEKKEAIMKKMKEELAKDVENLFSSEAELTEEFKSKAASLFEAVVTARVAHEMEELEDVLAEAAAEEIMKNRAELAEQVDGYLSYVAQHWLEENAVAVESGIRSGITEDFILGLKKLFQENYIDIPEEKYDVIGEMQEEIDELKQQLNATISESVVLNTSLTQEKRENVFNKVTADLAQTESEKLRALTENVSFDTEELFEEKLSVIKNNYFPKNTGTVSLLNEEDAVTEEVSSAVAKYAEILSRTK